MVFLIESDSISNRNIIRTDDLIFVYGDAVRSDPVVNLKLSCLTICLDMTICPVCYIVFTGYRFFGR